mmetsp:Transcript_32282/g.46577  ORF Transcript_32282/g.46577 Transcript_32282/m.46577 type:complete len:662 (+) Transcript_32282:770-2755(+)
MLFFVRLRFVNQKIVVSEKEDVLHLEKHPKYPNYEEYMVLARKQKYFPIDPTMKLLSTIDKYSQIFDVQEHYQKGTVDIYISALEKEIQFLLGVFRQTITDDSTKLIDLSSIFLLALRSLHQTTYSVIKYRLRSNQTSFITQSAVLQMAGHWLYGPVREILKIWKEHPANIIIDLNLSSGTERYNALMRAVQYKLYGLISVLGSLRKDLLIGALPVAVVNGDDLATALLLRLVATNSTDESVSIALHNCIQLAEQLGYDHVQKRLLRHVEYLTSYENSGVFDHSSLPIYNDFSPIEFNSLEVNATTTSNEHKEKKSGGLLSGIMGALRKKKNVADSAAECSNLIPEETYGGYNPLRVNIELSNNSSGNKVERICKVSRIHISNISVEHFHNLFVRRNIPVLLQTDFNFSRWKLSTILDKYGHVNVSFSEIPFGAIFGRKEKLATLKEFVSGEDGMHAYSEQLRSFLGFRSTFSSQLSQQMTASQVGNWLLNNKSKDEVNLPKYVFTEEVVTATQQDMVETMHQLGAGCIGNGSLVGECIGSNLEELVRSVGSALHFQFFLGPPLSGAPFHHHGPAFNVLAFGAKKWALAPPGRDIYTNLHPLELDMSIEGKQFEEYPFKQGPCQLLQQAGEVLFVPRHWSHQVLNLAESVGFAVEVSDYTH